MRLFRILPFCLIIFFFSGDLRSQSRIAIVDIVVDPVLDNQREDLLQDFRRILSQRVALDSLSQREIDEALLRINPLDEQQLQFQISQENQRREILRELEIARSHYRLSDFRKLLETLNAVLPSMNAASAVLREEEVREILTLLAVAEYFLGQRGRADFYLTALYDWWPEVVIPSAKYPPGILQRFTQIRQQREPQTERLALRVGSSPDEVKFLGRRLSFSEERGTILFDLPRTNPFLKNFDLVLEKEGFLTETFTLLEFPQRLEWKRLGSRPIDTTGLFDVIQTSEPRKDFDEVLEKISADLFVLARVTQDLDGTWIWRTQWINQNLTRRSAVMTAKHPDRRIGIELAVEQLLGLVSPEGEIVSRTSIWEVGPKREFEISPRSQNFYEKWWFWALVGSAAAGAGVGGYFLFKPDPKTKFVVSPVN